MDKVLVIGLDGVPFQLAGRAVPVLEKLRKKMLICGQRYETIPDVARRKKSHGSA